MKLLCHPARDDDYSIIHYFWPIEMYYNLHMGGCMSLYIMSFSYN